MGEGGRGRRKGRMRGVPRWRWWWSRGKPITNTQKRHKTTQKWLEKEREKKKIKRWRSHLRDTGNEDVEESDGEREGELEKERKRNRTRVKAEEREGFCVCCFLVSFSPYVFASREDVVLSVDWVIREREERETERKRERNGEEERNARQKERSRMFSRTQNSLTFKVTIEKGERTWTLTSAWTLCVKCELFSPNVRSTEEQRRRVGRKRKERSNKTRREREMRRKGNHDQTGREAGKQCEVFYIFLFVFR